MKMAVGADAVSNLGNTICAYLEEKGVELVRFAALKGDDGDFVDAARAVAEAVQRGEADQGLLFCTTGTGVTIVANKIPGVRAALCPDAFAAGIARLANNANVIALGTRLTGELLAKEIIDTWLATEPSTEPRRVRFHEKIDELEMTTMPSQGRPGLPGL
jgi:ribose 5-phosphate isomerase B